MEIPVRAVGELRTESGTLVCSQFLTFHVYRCAHRAFPLGYITNLAVLLLPPRPPSHRCRKAARRHRGIASPVRGRPRSRGRAWALRRPVQGQGRVSSVSSSLARRCVGGHVPGASGLGPRGAAPVRGGVSSTAAPAQERQAPRPAPVDVPAPAAGRQVRRSSVCLSGLPFAYVRRSVPAPFALCLFCLLAGLLPLGYPPHSRVLSREDVVHVLSTYT